MKHFQIMFILLIGFHFSNCSQKIPTSENISSWNSKNFSPWMTVKELDAYLAPFDLKDEKGNKYWGRRWISELETRWYNNYFQLRIRIADAPRKEPFWWYWYYDQSKEQMTRRLMDMTKENFQLVSFDNVILPNGETSVMSRMKYKFDWSRFFAEQDGKQVCISKDTHLVFQHSSAKNMPNPPWRASAFCPSATLSQNNDALASLYLFRLAERTKCISSNLAFHT